LAALAGDSPYNPALTTTQWTQWRITFTHTFVPRVSGSLVLALGTRPGRCDTRLVCVTKPQRGEPWRCSTSKLRNLLHARIHGRPAIAISCPSREPLPVHEPLHAVPHHEKALRNAGASCAGHAGIRVRHLAGNNTNEILFSSSDMTPILHTGRDKTQSTGESSWIQSILLALCTSF